MHDANIELLCQRMDNVSSLLKQKGLSPWAVNHWTIVYNQLLRQFHDTEHVPYNERGVIE